MPRSGSRVRSLRLRNLRRKTGSRRKSHKLRGGVTGGYYLYASPEELLQAENIAMTGITGRVGSKAEAERIKGFLENAGLWSILVKNVAAQNFGPPAGRAQAAKAVSDALNSVSSAASGAVGYVTGAVKGAYNQAVNNISEYASNYSDRNKMAGIKVFCDAPNAASAKMGFFESQHTAPQKKEIAEMRTIVKEYCNNRLGLAGPKRMGFPEAAGTGLRAETPERPTSRSATVQRASSPVDEAEAMRQLEYNQRLQEYNNFGGGKPLAGGRSRARRSRRLR